MFSYQDRVKFDVYRYWKDEVRQFNFDTPLTNLSYDVLSSHILETCYKEKNLTELYRFRVFYITFDGNHVEVDEDEIKFNAFLRFVRASKARTNEYIHLIIADDQNKERFFREPTTKKLEFQNLDSLFRTKIDCHNSYDLDKVVGNSLANIFIRQPSCPQSQKYPSEPGLLCVRRIDGQELSRLLVGGSQVFVATGENNFLSLNFLKEYEAVPYQLMCWRNRIGNFLAPEYQCEEVKIPVVIDDQANINIRHDFKNVIQFCEDNMKKSENIQQEIPMQTFQTPIQSQAYVQAQAQAQAQVEQQHHMMQYQNFMRDYHRLIQQPVRVNGNQACDEAQAQAQVDQQHQNFIRDYYRLIQQPVKVNENQACDGEENIQAWFDRRMESFKKDIIADIKEEVMKEVEKMFHIDNVEKVKVQHNEQEITKNTLKIVKEYTQTNVLRNDSNRETHEDWEVIKVISNPVNEISNLSEQSDESELNDVFPRENLTQADVHRELFESSSCIPEDCYDSDSSVSLIMDDSVDNEELLDGSDFVEIPRCFVTRENPDGGCSGRVPIRIKHRPSKTPKSGTPPTKFFSSKKKSDSEINCERSSHEDISPVLDIHQKQEEINASQTANSNENISNNDKSKNQDRRETRPVNILPDKVFEMTNNVLKNVLNSVKIIPHSNEVKESVQKVLEESLSAASRLIPNPLIAETSNFSDPRVQATNETSSTEAPADNVNNNGSSSPSTSGYNTSNFNDFSDEMMTNLDILNEMGFYNRAQNIFFLKKYPDNIEKVIESLVNFTYF